MSNELIRQPVEISAATLEAVKVKLPVDLQRIEARADLDETAQRDVGDLVEAVMADRKPDVEEFEEDVQV